MDKVPSEQQAQALAEGVLITTKSQRKGAKEVTARTLPCRITRMGGAASRRLEFVLVEGRNRQIRRMAEAVGLTVERVRAYLKSILNPQPHANASPSMCAHQLHRVVFAGIGLRGLSEGNWSELDEREMEVVRSAIRSSLGVEAAPGEELEDSVE